MQPSDYDQLILTSHLTEGERFSCNKKYCIYTVTCGTGEHWFAMNLEVCVRFAFQCCH